MVGFEAKFEGDPPPDCLQKTFSSLSLDQDIELSTFSLAPCLSGCCHASYHDDNRTSETVSQPELNVLYKSCLGHGASSQQ